LNVFGSETDFEEVNSDVGKIPNSSAHCGLPAQPRPWPVSTECPLLMPSNVDRRLRRR
jgi:hypothetical protein